MPFIDRRGAVVEAPSAPVISVDFFDRTPDLSEPAMVLIFDSFVDGRAFSAAALLRAEGYVGVLIGAGEVGLDRLAYGFRVGFDLLWIAPSEQALLQLRHLQPFPHSYQADQASGAHA